MLFCRLYPRRHSAWTKFKTSQQNKNMGNNKWCFLSILTFAKIKFFFWCSERKIVWPIKINLQTRKIINSGSFLLQIFCLCLSLEKEKIKFVFTAANNNNNNGGMHFSCRHIRMINFWHFCRHRCRRRRQIMSLTLIHFSSDSRWRMTSSCQDKQLSFYECSFLPTSFQSEDAFLLVQYHFLPLFYIWQYWYIYCWLCWHCHYSIILLAFYKPTVERIFQTVNAYMQCTYGNDCHLEPLGSPLVSYPTTILAQCDLQVMRHEQAKINVKIGFPADW